ncbi:MAG: hypothetical protein ABI318_07305 [Chthoniobacteraceae bacterium]
MNQTRFSYRRIALTFAVVGGAFLAGCASSDRGNAFAPQSPLASGAVAELEKELSRPGLLDDGRWKTPDGRNELVQKLMFVCDYHFSQYEAKIVVGKAVRDTVFDQMIFGLTTAASLTTGAPAAIKTLSAVAGGLAFTRTNYEKNFFQNQTMPVLIRKMHAMRKEKANQIAERLTLSTKSYSVYAAIIDLLDYYNRGTVLAAIQAISDDTSLQEFKLKGGTVTEPPQAETAVARYGRFKADEFNSKAGRISRKTNLPDNDVVMVNDAYNTLRNKRLQNAFERLASEPEKARAYLIAAKIPDAATDPNPLRTLAGKILEEAKIPFVAGKEVSTLTKTRMSARNDPQLGLLEKAYEKYITDMPEKPLPPQQNPVPSSSSTDLTGTKAPSVPEKGK